VGSGVNRGVRRSPPRPNSTARGFALDTHFELRASGWSAADDSFWYLPPSEPERTPLP